MNPLKKRTKPRVSKRKVVSMMNLFEKYIDGTIAFIDVELGRIQTTDKKLYDVDIKTNKVEPVDFEWYELEINEPFD